MKQFNSWTIAFYRQWRPYLSLASIIKLRSLSMRDKKGQSSLDRTARVTVLAPFRSVVVLREMGSDVDTLEEIVVKNVYQGVVKHLRKCKTVIDLGSNIGLASLYFAAKYPDSKFFAVEANPVNFDILRTNLALLTRSGRCQFLMAAAWSHEDTLSIQMEDVGDYNLGSVSGRTQAVYCFPVQAYSMATIMKMSNFEQVDLLKVDIEGAEAVLFEGCLDWLARVNAIAIEFHEDSRAESRFDLLMQQHHFHIVHEDIHTVVAVRQS